jgi:acetyl esterase/lipase
MKEQQPRRTFLKQSTAALAALAAVRVAPAEDKPIEKQTFTYKTVGSCAIKADVYRPGNADDPSPVVVWIHGGALIVGDRNGIIGPFRDGLLKAGITVVSIDYRLAPETKLPAILSDVRDAFTWVREEGPKRFNIDPSRLAVAGGSAGGYLTLTTGYLIKPRPRVLVSFWGYGDITGPWYSKPDEFYRKQPLVSKEEAEAAIGKTAISEGSGKNNRGKFYLYCRQQGLWPKEVAGLDPETNPKAFDPFCPIRNIDGLYPPTLLIHGTKDTDVPYELSESMAGALNDRRVVAELITIPDAGHGLSGAKPELVAQVYDRVVDFVRGSLM